MTLNKQSSMTVTFSKLKVIGWNPTINKSCYFQICLTMNTLICYTATKKNPNIGFLRLHGGNSQSTSYYLFQSL